LYTVQTTILDLDEASLSTYACSLLGAKNGDIITLSHPSPLNSLSYVRSKIYGNTFEPEQLDQIIQDVVAGSYSEIHTSSFLTACAGGHLNLQEITWLTAAMVNAGKRLKWPAEIVVDKHCVGGLPGNRTTLIIVPIVTAFGLTMPKTSSRAITSPAGTADTMEVLAPVELDINAMRKVVDQENGCIIWGGSVDLSPADDILIRVERVLNLDSDGQLVASILSKKIAAGSTHIVIDMPIGPTAKIRTKQNARLIESYLSTVAAHFDVTIKMLYTNGIQPIGRGIGPALEARDVLEVLQRTTTAPQDLRDRALTIAGHILEFSPQIKEGTGKLVATEILDSGRAWKKFQAICAAQGGMREPKIAKYKEIVSASSTGQITAFNNREIAKIATLAGAPNDPAAGIDLHVSLSDSVRKGQPLFTIHAESKGGLDYALSVLTQINDLITIEVKD
jgi:thymidine phosphorylase